MRQLCFQLIYIRFLQDPKEKLILSLKREIKLLRTENAYFRQQVIAVKKGHVHRFEVCRVMSNALYSSLNLLFYSVYWGIVGLEYLTLFQRLNKIALKLFYVNWAMTSTCCNLTKSPISLKVQLSANEKHLVCCFLFWLNVEIFFKHLVCCCRLFFSPQTANPFHHTKFSLPFST